VIWESSKNENLSLLVKSKFKFQDRVSYIFTDSFSYRTAESSFTGENSWILVCMYFTQKIPHVNRSQKSHISIDVKSNGHAWINTL